MLYVRKMKKTLRQNLQGLTKQEYKILKKMSHKSKDLYNETLYKVRQYFFNNGEYLSYYDNYERLKGESENYKVLPSQIAQQTMKHVDKAFKSFFNLIKEKKRRKIRQRSTPTKLPRKRRTLFTNLSKPKLPSQRKPHKNRCPKKFQRKI
ncbi:MAG: IS605 OrfB-like transposable element containing RNAse H-like and Zn finger domain [Candidatus Methanohalarchaeum thermophilum]|uniref:IS605 OrfB-like transposable element containing RNAse H-like and Zn finger domain n=1 Tax=Methanohalarchaeum thermophilum TaxID=1903181 RepID=A0A1Q6DT42_METT1|nr:MAG: IS605 OrfB-like transposable element containing RNAse H-like and Zn finger domain [Candidatus Methanohalarchaeum thermophilum]